MELCVAIACLAATATGGAAQAQTVPGRYGGGFIEFLVTGNGTPPRPSRPGLADDGVLPRHPASYGYGGQPIPRPLSSGDRVLDVDPYAAPVRTRLAALPSQPGPEMQTAAIERTPDPRYERQVVAFDGRQKPGSIVIDTQTKYLYLVQPGGQAIRYGIGVGRPGFVWSGMKTISQKREWPDWTPPAEMLQRRPDLPRHMAGGPANPLGARALYLGSSLYRIHGTNEPHTIGQSVSSGCIRMMNEDVIDLYERTPVGTKVEVL
ncbi:L,D-transpeptidase [Methylobacterium marchantiae]|uniref:L,D-transpeptidase n=1 Tax=Methylobacterium marchantiae TaxID=600331 RepID=A0ABW3WUZ8_9HYPH